MRGRMGEAAGWMGGRREEGSLRVVTSLPQAENRLAGPKDNI